MSGKKDHGSHRSEESDGASQYYSVAGGSSTASTTDDFVSCASSSSSTSTAYLSFSTTPTPSEPSNADKKSVKTLQVSSEEWNEDFSNYDEKTDEFLGTPPPGKNFPGKLADGEKWLMCPYYPAHFYMYA